MKAAVCGLTPHNLGCWTVRARAGPCNACATYAGAQSAAPLSTHHFNAAQATLLLAEVISLLRLLNGQGKQLQTTTTPGTPAWQTLSSHHTSEGVGAGIEIKR